MVAALFDTNILIDYLRGIEAARLELSQYSEKFISIISWMEVMVGVQPEHEAATRLFLSGFEVCALDEATAERAVEIRRNAKMKLPDAIIWAAADIRNLLLVTRNVKDFPEGSPGIRYPYTL